eukprot:Gb_03213 [translate_table: standard]
MATMALAPARMNQKKKMTTKLLFLGLMLELHGRKSTTLAFKREGHANYGSLEDVRKLCEQGRLKEALHILHGMDHRADSSAWVHLLQSCIKRNGVLEGKLVHAHVTERGYLPDRFLQNTLVNMYAKCGSLVESRRVFDQMPERDGFSWTVMIAAYSKNGCANDALTMYSQMQRTGIQPDQFTFASILAACASLAALEQGKEIHEVIIRSSFYPDIILWNALVDMYAKCGSIEDARDVFDQMPQRNVVSWNAMVAGYAQNGLVEEALELFLKMSERNVVSWTAMISGYAQNGHGKEALKLFQEMQLAGVKANMKTFTSVIPACTNLTALEQGMEIHENLIRSGFQHDVFVESALVDMYAKCGSIQKARYLFDKMHQRNTFSWTAMIAGYAQNGHVDEALKLFQKMPERGTVSWTAMIAGYAHNGHVDEALKLFEEMPERDIIAWNAMLAGYVENGYVDEAMKFFQKMPERSMVSWNAMIAGYTQKGSVDEAMELFEKMPERNVVSWTTMIAGYMQNGHGVEALNLFLHMQLAGVKPDSYTFVSLLPACATLAALEHGMEVHKEVIKSGLQSDVCVANALVDMYAKCGSIENARHVFDKMAERDVVSWTSMIGGYAMHGCAKEALNLFEEMQFCGTNPSHVTLLSVLSACCHAGLVDEGKQYFASMSQYYNITPAMEHYGCMVDLLGRAGHLDEAQDFINRMPIKPDATVWGCLLGACRVHNNIELGEQVAECLFALDPKNPAHYVVLSNIYASAGKLGDVEKVRKMMKDRSIKKKPGCSWIEINKQVYAFLVGHRSHLQTKEIYANADGGVKT